MSGNFDVHIVIRLDLIFPVDLNQTMGFFSVRRRQIHTVRAVHGHASSPRDIPDDLVPRHRIAAARKAHKQIVDAFDAHPVSRFRSFDRWRGFHFPDLFRQFDLPAVFLLLALFFRQAGADLGRRDASESDRGIHVLDVVEVELPGHFQQFLIRHDVRRFESETADFFFQRLPALLDIFLPLLLLEPLLDFAFRMGGLRNFDPVLARAVRVLGCENLHNVSRLQPVIERHDASVHLGPDRPVPDFRMNPVREIKRNRPGGKFDDLPFRGEYIHEVGKEIHFQGFHKL